MLIFMSLLTNAAADDGAMHVVLADTTLHPDPDEPRSEVCDALSPSGPDARLERFDQAVRAHSEYPDEGGPPDWLVEFSDVVRSRTAVRQRLRAWLRDAPRRRACDPLCQELRELAQVWTVVGSGSTSFDRLPVDVRDRARRAEERWPQSPFLPWYVAYQLAGLDGDARVEAIEAGMASDSEAVRSAYLSWLVCENPPTPDMLDTVGMDDLDDLRKRYPLVDWPLVAAAADRGNHGFLSSWSEGYGVTLLDRVASQDVCARPVPPGPVPEDLAALAAASGGTLSIVPVTDESHCSRQRARAALMLALADVPSDEPLVEHTVALRRCLDEGARGTNRGLRLRSGWKWTFDEATSAKGVECIHAVADRIDSDVPGRGVGVSLRLGPPG